MASSERKEPEESICQNILNMGLYNIYIHIYIYIYISNVLSVSRGNRTGIHTWILLPSIAPIPHMAFVFILYFLLDSSVDILYIYFEHIFGGWTYTMSIRYIFRKPNIFTP